MPIWRKDPPVPPEREPEPDPPPPRPEWPRSIKCNACKVRYAQRHCRLECAWYACSCGARTWIRWDGDLAAWLVKRLVRNL